MGIPCGHVFISFAPLNVAREVRLGLATLLGFSAAALVLLFFHRSLDRLRNTRPFVAGALFGSIGTIPTLWLLQDSPPSAPELLIKMLLSGFIWALVAWIRVWEKQHRSTTFNQQI